MLYLLVVMQIVLLILVILLYLTMQAKSPTISQIWFSKEELLRWQNTTSSMIKELENILSEITKDFERETWKLEELIREADKRISYLNNLIENFPIKEVKELFSEDASAKAITDRYDRIFELVNQGLNVVDIAKKTKVGRGEVQLILDLKKKKDSQ